MGTGWGWGGSSLESPGATLPGFPSLRPGLGWVGGVWGPRPGLTLLGLSPSSPWRSEMETSLAPRPRSPGQEWPLGVCAPSVRYGPSDSGSLTMCPQSSVSRPKTPVPVLFSPEGSFCNLFWFGAVSLSLPQHWPSASPVPGGDRPFSHLFKPSVFLSPLHSRPPLFLSSRVLGHSLTGAPT